MSWAANRQHRQHNPEKHGQHEQRGRPPLLRRAVFIDDSSIMDTQPGMWGSQWGEYQPDISLQATEIIPESVPCGITEDANLPYSAGQPVDPTSYLYVMDSVAIDQQKTWIIPEYQKIPGVPVTEPVVTAATEPTKGAATEAESYTSIIRRLVANSGIYALASLVSPLVSLVLSPFLAHHLSHSDYGVLLVLNPTIALLTGITQLGLGIAFFRAYSQDYVNSPRKRLHAMATVTKLLFLIAIPVLLILLVLAPRISELLFHSAAFAHLIVLMALVVLFQNLTVPGFSWLRAESRAIPFAMLSVLNLFITLGATLLFVGTFGMGVAGALCAMGGGSALIVAVTLPMILRRAGLRLHLNIARNLLTFGLSTVPGLLSVWVLQLSDRYLLIHFRSLAETASYAVAYTLGSVVGPLVIVPFSLAWYSMFYTIARKENAADLFRLVFRWYGFVLLLAVFGLSLTATFLLDLFFPPAYHAAATIIPFVALSTMFYGLFDVVVVGVYIRRRLRFNFIFTPVAALLNVVCNLILIPPYGAMGAAIATLIAYATLTVLAYMVNQKIYPLPFEIGLFGIALLTGILLYIGNMFVIQQQQTYGAWSISLCACCLYAGCLVFLGKLPARAAKQATPGFARNSRE